MVGAWSERRDAVNGNPWQPAPRPSIDPSFIEALQPRPASTGPTENSTLSRELKTGRSGSVGLANADFTLSLSA